MVLDCSKLTWKCTKLKSVNEVLLARQEVRELRGFFHSMYVEEG